MASEVVPKYPYLDAALTHMNRQQQYNNFMKSVSTFDVQPASIAASAAGLANTYFDMRGQSLGLGNLAPADYQYGQQPYYDAGQFYNKAAMAEAQGANAGEYISAGLQGAQLGTAIMPGIGTAIGAGLGVGVAALGGRARKRKQQGEINDALAAAGQRQQGFNEASKNFSEQQLAYDDYINRMDTTQKLYNLYRTV